MRTMHTIPLLSATVVLAAGAGLLLTGTAQAKAAAVACSETALVSAVNTTNAAGGGVITLTPGCTYTLTSAHGNDGTHGLDGLPPITTAVTFEGNANVITRRAGCPCLPYRPSQYHGQPHPQKRDPQQRLSHRAVLRE